MATRTWSVTTRSAALRRTAAFRGRTARRAGAVAAPAHELAPAVGSHVHAHGEASARKAAEVDGAGQAPSTAHRDAPAVHPHDRGDDPLPVSEPAQADPEPTPA